MVIELKQLQIENFLSLGKTNLTLSNQGLVLVQGLNKDSSVADSNGAGKSAIFEALLWALFGRTFRGLTGDDVINRKIGRDCAVGLSFSLSGQNCELLRFRRFEKQGSGLVFEVNGVDKSRPTMPETQKELEKLLGFGYESFTHAVYFGQALAHFSSLPDSQQKKVLEELLGLSILPKSLVIVRERLRISTGIVTRLETKLAMMEREKAGIEERIEDLEAAQTKQKKQQAEIITNLKKSLVAVREKAQQAQENFKELEKGFNELSQQLGQKDNKAQSASLECRTELTKAKAVLDGIQNRVVTLGMQDLTYCPYIKGECELEKERAAKEAEELEKQLVMYMKRVKELNKQATKLRKEGEVIEKQQKLLTKKGYKVTDAHNLQLTLDSTVESYEDKLKEAGKEAAKATELEELLGKEFKRLRTKKVNINKMGQGVLRHKTQRRLLEFWEVGFGNAGVKSYMLDSVAEILNQKVDEFTRFLTDGEMGISFQTQSTLKSGEVREKFDISIIGQSGETTYAASSGGERRRIDVCILLALSELTGLHGKLPNLLVLDEVFDHLDREGMNRVVALLRSKLLKQRETVFVITHSETLANYFERRLVVTKENGISSINVAKG